MSLPDSPQAEEKTSEVPRSHRPQYIRACLQHVSRLARVSYISLLPRLAALRRTSLRITSKTPALRTADKDIHWLRRLRFRGRRRWIVAISVLLVFVLLVSQLNGDFGAWLADVSRAVLGAQRTAQIESWFLNIEDDLHQAEYHVTGQRSAAPWTAPAAALGIRRARGLRAPRMMSLPPMTPIVQPTLPGEGVWTTDGLPLPGAGQPPSVAKAFLRPDPARPYAVVTMLQFDLRTLSLHLVSGTTEPGGPLGHDGTGVVPSTVLNNRSLVAIFNGGFKYPDGHYGLMTDGTMYVPPVSGAATLAVTRQGQVIMGAWGQDPRLSLTDTNLVSWRQNGALLIDHGQLNPLTSDGAAWGGVWLNRAYTWRSAIGLTNHGTLIYAAGDSLSAATLGRALQAAGAVMALQTDINPKWVRAFTYQWSSPGNLQIAKLDPGMQGVGNEYFLGRTSDRDFFYLTRT